MENKTVKLELTIEELNKILMGLGELKASQSIELILKIQEEAKKQLQE